MDYTALSELLYPNIRDLPTDAEARYPARALPEGAIVTRVAPSPTGFVHFGNLFPAITSERLAHQSGGVFFLRIEDTDEKREVPGAVEMIIDSFRAFGVAFDEGVAKEGDYGDYGPYRQRQRKEIYHIYAKELVRNALAYPCFCSEDELQKNRDEQEAEKAPLGYHGRWARHRNATLEEIRAELDAGTPFVLRFRSEGSAENKFKFRDLIKGEIDVSENHIDHVLLKSDGIPTYHFAHVVDDHLMRTTHVVRGDEWLSTLPFHLQLFRALGFQIPKFLHVSPLMKQDGDSKRKLSKRKDPEAALSFYEKEGYPAAAVREYVMTLLNSNFEEWRMQHPDADLNDFPFSAKKMSVSGSLFDMDKLRDVSKNVISRMPAETVYRLVADYLHSADPAFYDLFARDPAYTTRILAIGRGGKKPRKDFACFSEVKRAISFFFDELFESDYPFPALAANDIAAILGGYPSIFNAADDRQAWFERVRTFSESLGYCPDMKVYKQNPDAYPGNVGDVSMVLRVAVCGRQESPDLYDVMSLLGAERVAARLRRAADAVGGR